MAAETARRKADLDTAIAFAVSVPGLISAYYLSHEMAYGALAKVGWAEGLVAGALLCVMVAYVVRTAPQTFRQVYRLNEPARAGPLPIQ
jgi:hypothetical protein